MSTKFVAVFDQSKSSDRGAVHILIAAVETFELDIKFFDSVRLFEKKSQKILKEDSKSPIKMLSWFIKMEIFFTH